MHKYYFNVEYLCVIKDYKDVIISGFSYALETKPVCEGEAVLMPIADIAKIFAKKYEVTVGDAVLNIADGDKTASAAISTVDGCDMADAAVLLAGIGWHRQVIKTREGNEYSFFTAEEAAVPRGLTDNVDNLARCFKEGHRHESFWFEEGGKVVPYQIYTPVDYDPEKKYPVIFFLHGGGAPSKAPAGTVNLVEGMSGRAFTLERNAFENHCEKEQIILVGCDAFVRDSTYGYPYSPNPGDPNMDYSCPENPMHLTEEEAYGKVLGEKALEATIKCVCERYSIDTSRMILMGNSMGGEGTFWFAAQHPGMFAAICPAGAMINLRVTNTDGLKGTPILFTGGTEDMHGFDYLKNGVKELEKQGMDISHYYVGGGTHGEAWSTVLPETFEFIKAHIK